MTAALAVSGSRAAEAELFVVVACHAFPCALPARRVVRLLLADEVPAASDGVIRAGDGVFAAWNLGEMLHLGPLGDAWILLNVPHGGATVPIALQTGMCLSVQPIATRFPLPPGLFRGRPGALESAFLASEVRAGQAGLVGLHLDLASAWTAQELDRSASAVSSVIPARGKGAGRS